MRRLVVLIGLLVLVATAVAMAGGEPEVGKFVISGYPIGEFAVKGAVEDQLNQLVKEIQPKLQTQPGQLQITVIGSADVTGSSVSNDRLARDRAEQIASVLSANFPEAKINAWSKGDAENVRQVRVEHRIIPTPAPAPSVTVTPPPVKEPAVSPVVVGIVGTAGILIVGIFTLWRISRRKAKKVGEESRAQWIDLEINGGQYSIRVEVKNGMWYSPFISRSGKRIKRDSRRGIIESLKGCLKKDEFRPQRDELIRQRVVKPTWT